MLIEIFGIVLISLVSVAFASLVVYLLVFGGILIYELVKELWEWNT